MQLEYLRMAAGKTHEIQKELEEKRLSQGMRE